MKKNRNLNFEIENDVDLNKMLMGLLMDVRRGEVDHETTKSITLVVDKLNKNNVNSIEYKKITKHNKPLPYFEPKED